MVRTIRFVGWHSSLIIHLSARLVAVFNKNIMENIELLLSKIHQIKIAIYGDYCLDAYWILDPRKSEISLETDFQAEAISKQSYSLGGTSNVVANLAALKPAKIKVFGVVGDDIFGREMVSQLKDLNVDITGLFTQQENFSTYVFCKRILEGEELPRHDFGIYNQRTVEIDRSILKNLRETVTDVDVVIINQKVQGSITNAFFIEGINELIADFPDKLFLVDSRHDSHLFKNVILRTNEFEAARLNGLQVSQNDVFSVEDVKVFTEKIFNNYKKPVITTRAAYGIIACDDSGLCEIPGLQFLKKIDTVGAGDAILSALTCALAAGASTIESIRFANFAAGVVIQKLFQTGTASPDEIIELAADPNYIYQPELAQDIRHAVYYNNSEMEVCYPIEVIERGIIKHAVFDHDGTLSALREGWEKVMEPVMIKSILGDQFESADETLYYKVVNRVQQFIDQSTGIQTILQMEGLIDLVREFRIVPEENILDKFGYKEIYNKALMEMVNKRIKKLENGELEVSDYVIKGAIEFLQMLRTKKVILYLASGTDREDVINEAKVMGYADLFNGGIYGAIGDVSKYSKKIVLNKIMNDNNLHGPELITVGDGPVEMRECRKAGGTAIGIASDEIRRHDLNIEKRTRLIRAGAQMIIPDFSQAAKLVDFLAGKGGLPC